jgi:geranylgeranyl diphosphate synthase type II
MPIEKVLETAIARAGLDAPPKLAGAMRDAVFPGGARVRPRLVLEVAQACGYDEPELALGAAAAIELLHCASLVHDDLPCFDDACMRRGLPSVPVKYGEALAVLTGDALIVLAFETLTRSGATAPYRLAPLVAMIAKGVGMPGGIVAGQAWESEDNPPVERYHRAKTGALFMAATMAGAVSAGRDPEPWRRLGACLGEAYQVADDLLDAASTAELSDKPVGRDAALGRPSAVTELGVDGAVARLERLVDEAVASVPDCREADQLRELVRMQANRLTPKRLMRTAA